jgi:HNH endonuclease
VTVAGFGCSADSRLIIPSAVNHLSATNRRYAADYGHRRPDAKNPLGKAGGRCSICRVQLVTEGTEGDDPSVFGEEAHIVAQSSNGPRGNYLTRVDAYDNLILLCSKHHKQIDDQTWCFTVERLREIKSAHELWIANLGEAKSCGSVQLVPDPTRPIPKVLKICTTGSRLWHLVDSSAAFYPSWPAGLSDEHEDLIAAFLDDLRDWNDCVGDQESYKAKRDASRGLDEHIKRLAEAGFVVGARKRFCLLTGGVQQEPSPWRVIDIEIQPAALAQIVGADGKPLGFGEGIETGVSW